MREKLKSITLRMQNTKTRSVWGMGIKRAENNLDLERDLNFDELDLVNELFDNHVAVLDFGGSRGSRRGRSCDVVITSVSCKVLQKHVGLGFPGAPPVSFCNLRY